MTLTVEEKAHALYRGVALAPMVRASTTPLRTLALKYGADWVYTEEFVDRALSATIRVENKEMGTIDFLKDVTKMSAKVQRRIEKEGGAPLLLRIDPAIERGKLVCQIGTGEPELALQAALHVHRDVDGIDVNMGCPRKFSTSGGMGSALLTDPVRACSIIKILRDNLDIPVSAKIRLLKDTASTIDFVTGLVNAGALAVAVHGRKVGDEGQHSADWETLKEVISICKAKFPHIDFLVNGDFYTRQEWTEFMAETGASGVLLGRPALFNTSIFRKPPPILQTSSTDSDAVVTTYGYDSNLLLDKTVVVQDYLREAVKYNIHHINVKYVIGESMNNRRAPSQRSHLLVQHFPGGQTIGRTCDCHTLEDLCKVWNVDFDKNVLLRSSQKAAPAGEHRYNDAYLLGDCKKVEHLPTAEGSIDPPPKRVRIDSP
jgi:tRNA-dihydrouridine synthase 2